MTSSEIQQINAADFTAEVIAEMRERPLSESAPEKVRTLTYLSYLPNALSLATGSFFVFYLTQGYPFGVKVGLIVILTAILTANEYAKRQGLASTFKRAFVRKRVPAASVFLLVIAGGISMVSSYEGGRQLVLENSKPPTLSANPQIATLEDKLSDVKQSIIKQQNTTWKGVITVDANRNLKRLYPIQEQIESELSVLRAADREAQSLSDAKHNTRTVNFGYVLGIIAVLADLVLLLIIRAIYQTKANLYKLLTRRPSPTRSKIRDIEDGGETAPGESLETDVYNVVNGYTGSEILQMAVKGAKAQASAYRKRNTMHAKNTVDRLERFVSQATEALEGTAIVG